MLSVLREVLHHKDKFLDSEIAISDQNFELYKFSSYLHTHRSWSFVCCTLLDEFLGCEIVRVMF